MVKNIRAFITALANYYWCWRWLRKSMNINALFIKWLLCLSLNDNRLFLLPFWLFSVCMVAPDKVLPDRSTLYGDLIFASLQKLVVVNKIYSEMIQNTVSLPNALSAHKWMWFIRMTCIQFCIRVYLTSSTNFGDSFHRWE